MASERSGNTAGHQGIIALRDRRRVPARPTKDSPSEACDWAVPSHRIGRQIDMRKQSDTTSEPSHRSRRDVRSIQQVAPNFRVMRNAPSHRSGRKGHVTTMRAEQTNPAIVQLTLHTSNGRYIRTGPHRTAIEPCTNPSGMRRGAGY